MVSALLHKGADAISISAHQLQLNVIHSITNFCLLSYLCLILPQNHLITQVEGDYDIHY